MNFKKNKKEINTEWRVKEFSRQLKVSIQTLHYYDRIGLLKPYVKHLNGYRIYTENELKKLKMILALKFFGCSLDQIRKVFNNECDLLDLLKIQARIFLERAKWFNYERGFLNKFINSLDSLSFSRKEEVLDFLEKSYDKIPRND